MPVIKPFPIFLVHQKAPVGTGTAARRRFPAPATDTSGGCNGTGRHLAAVRKRERDRTRRADAKAAETPAITEAGYRQLSASGEMGPYPKPVEFVNKPPLAEVFAKCPILGC